jgi:hypothetical protein
MCRGLGRDYSVFAAAAATHHGIMLLAGNDSGGIDVELLTQKIANTFMSPALFLDDQ